MYYIKSNYRYISLYNLYKSPHTRSPQYTIQSNQRKGEVLQNWLERKGLDVEA